MARHLYKYEIASENENIILALGNIIPFLKADAMSLCIHKMRYQAPFFIFIIIIFTSRII